MYISEKIKYVGVNDHEVDLFEGQYVVPNGMAYNSYMIFDEKVAVLDTVDAKFFHEWMENVKNEANGKAIDYLIVQHMEPDHSANIKAFLDVYKTTKIVSSSKAFTMMKQFFGDDFSDRRIVVGEGDTLSLGKKTLTFVTAPMVHWPEVIVTYDSEEKVLFSADGFGKFGALDADEDWACEARRYYFGIVGKYGTQVQALLKKASNLDIKTICPLHGPILTQNLDYYLNLYNIWSSYGVESEGIMIAYTSVYSNTKRAVELLRTELIKKGCPKVVVADLARDDMAEAVEDAFRYGKLVLATTTYNADIFPFMKQFIEHLTERNYQNRTLAFIENGSWAPVASKIMKAHFENSKNLTFCENNVTIRSALSEESINQISALANELCKDYENSLQSEEKHNSKALFNIGYGLYVITSKDGEKDNGFIGNSVMQLTSTPERIAVTISKQNYSYYLIKNSGIMNLNCLSIDTGLDIFKNFGYVSGRTVDKFSNVDFYRSDNGLAVLNSNVNSYISLKVEDFIDLGTHGLFICSVTEAKIINDKETMTYSYYQKNVKQSSNLSGKKGFSCRICGYLYEGDVLPADFTCPICKHPASDFEEFNF